MIWNAAGNRAWRPKGRPKPHTRHNGYSHAEGGVATSYSAFGAFMGRVKACLGVSLLFAACLTVAQQSVAQVTVPGTVLRNVGSVAYEVAPGASRTTQSNEVTLAVEPLPTRSSIQLGRYQGSSSTSFTAGPTQCRSANGFVTLAPPAPQGVGPLDPATPIPMQDTTVAHAGDPMFVRVVDLDRNRDGTVVETVDVRVAAKMTGDSEVLRLTETGPNTGVFVGYIPTTLGTAANDCALAVERNTEVDATYVDPTDSTDASEADALV